MARVIEQILSVGILIEVAFILLLQALNEFRDLFSIAIQFKLVWNLRNLWTGSRGLDKLISHLIGIERGLKPMSSAHTHVITVSQSS